MLSSQRFCTQCGAANRQQAAFCFACGQSLDQSDNDEAYTSTNTTLSTSRLLKDRYRVLSRLGSGGMGAVDKAEDTLFNQRLVAIKEMSQVGLNAQQRREAAADFKREAYMLANLQHQGLPTIYDYFSDEGQWYLVMDFIEGETLEDYLNKNAGWLPIKKALAIGIQLCNVLSYLHTRQPPIIFRDLKPANIMITPKEQVVLIDFGIARHFKPGQLKDTVSFGSAGYAAPEQYGKTQTTPRSDIYSLGVILHQCLTGNDPSANSPTPFDFPPLDLHDQTAPPSLQDMIRQMLAMNPANRPEHMGVVLQQLIYTDRQLSSLQTQQKAQAAIIRIQRSPAPAMPPASTIPYTRTKPTLQDPIPERPETPIPVPTLKIVVPQPTTSNVKEYHFHSGIMRAMALSPDGTILALGDDRGQVIMWDIAKSKTITAYHPHTYAISSLAWSPKKGIVASTDINNLLIVLNTATGNNAFNVIFRYRTQVSMLLSIVWSSDGDRIAFSDSRGIVSIRSAIDGKSISQYSGHTSAVTALSWSLKGEFIASGDKAGQVQVWQVDTLKLQATYTGQGPISVVAFSPDGEILLAADKTGHASLWSLATQKLLTTYAGHSPQQITACAWSPHGEYVATGSSDTTIHIWKVDTGAHVMTHARHQAAILGVAWLPDGENIISMDVDNNLHITKVR